jgi:hypothetical protein
MVASKNAPKSKYSSYFSGIIYGKKKKSRELAFFSLQEAKFVMLTWSSIIYRHLNSVPA